MPVVRKNLSFLAIAGLSAIAALVDAAQPPLVVNLASGRQFRGELDEASTAEQLVLRTTVGGLTLRREILWQRIERAELDGQSVEVAKLRSDAARTRGSGVGGRGSGVGRSLLGRIEMRGTVPSAEQASEASAAELPMPRVTMISFDPYIANWDADVETDGLVIDIAPLDSNRFVVPAGGTLEVELFARQRRTLDLAPQSGGDTLELVERWSRAVVPEDFGPGGVRFRLPFGAIHPELQPNWTAWWYGLVHVRLSIPGHGVFDDSRDGVRIRPYAPNRDRQEQKTGERFLPTENLGRRE
jgi:hypothetical protein